MIGKSGRFFAAPRAAIAVLLAISLLGAVSARAAGLTAGVAKVDITNRDAGPVNDPLYAKALVLKNDATSAVIITVDAVAIGEIGYIGNDFLPTVRARIEKELGIPATNVMVNASHCHGIVCADVAERTFNAVKQAVENLVPVTAGAGSGQEDRVSENRRFKLKSGREADSRHAYSIPPDDAIAGVGPIDPEIGLLKLAKEDGETFAVVYNFAVHPIQGVPNGGNTADLTGFASQVIEDNTGGIALFLQGCAGDINPAMYKDVNLPRDAEPLGNMLALSALKAVRGIATKEIDQLKVLNQSIELPRADTSEQIAAMEAERLKLLESLQGTSLNLKTFLPLVVKYSLAEEFPAYYAHRYMHETMMGRENLKKLDAENRKNMQQYIDNIHIMEELTRLQANLALLRKHQSENAAAEKRTIDVEVVGLRVGDFVLITFPGELTVQTGLDIKAASPHEQTFVAGYTNGYIYYAPTAEQLQNVGGAQEDSDCVLAPEWHPLFKAFAAELIEKL